MTARDAAYLAEAIIKVSALIAAAKVERFAPTGVSLLDDAEELLLAIDIRVTRLGGGFGPVLGELDAIRRERRGKR